jgi:hypothetical protein
MVSYNFLLPEPLGEPDLQALSRSYLISGTEYVPWPTEVTLGRGELAVHSPVSESSCLSAPWSVDGQGHFLLTTGSLMQRAEPYHLVLELARGKVNHLRTQAADWEMGGLVLPEELRKGLRSVSANFAHAACNQDDAGTIRTYAQKAIDQAVALGDQLVDAYMAQVLQFRLAREKPLPTLLACRINGPTPDTARTGLLRDAVNAVQLPFHWPTIEPTEGEYVWTSTDSLISWAETQGWGVVGGPVIDFADHALPEWLGRYRGDLRRIINYMDDYLEMVLQRYGDRIKTWELAAGSNLPNVLGLSKDELLHLTNRLFDTAAQLKPDSSFVLGLAQPWGEYLGREERAYFPLLFTDALLRNRASVAAIDVEILMGVQPRGSLLRDALELTRILDLYSLLGLPLRVTVGCPSSAAADPQTRGDYTVQPRGGPAEWSPDVQARWADQCIALAVCKPFVEAVTWIHFADDQPHWFPHGGLIGSDGQPKPVVARLQELRRAYLR